VEKGDSIMKLPNGEHAVVDIAKLRDYCLNPEHLRGKHKARVFAAALGLNADHVEELQATLLQAARNEEAMVADRDEFGQRFVVDFTMKGPSGEGRVRSSWIVKNGEDFPRLTSCYML
jgi:hypothetical protein